MRSNFAKLMKQIRKNFPDTDLEIVRKAYRRANLAHQGQVRLSGEPYVIHSLKVAQNLAALGLDPVTCAAGLLHDVIEDTDVASEALRKEFGADIASLVDGVTKIGSLSFSEEQLTAEVKQAQNIRKMLVATAQDVRVILIKLADRLHNISTIEHLPREKQVRIARETLEIYAPLAHRLGISHWRWQLEDHAFHCLKPETYRDIARKVAVKRRQREAALHDIIQTLDTHLREAGVQARVIGRPKHLYSIYDKMSRQGKDFSELLDLQAVRIITQTESGCYNALGVVHRHWKPVPGRLKDYVAVPKLNMYQAIHTTVMMGNGHPLEVQIRSEDMDRTANEGIAAHWIYKEGERHEDKKLDKQLTWLRQMFEWLKDAHAPEELLDSMKSAFQARYRYVFTPKGEVKELPSGATPLDFAYLVHSDIGHHCIGARVNGRMVPLRYHLQTGDVVEILTSKNQTPHLEWQDIVVTARARAKVRQRLREMGALAPVEKSDTTENRSRHKPEPVTRVPVQTIRQVDEATRQKLILIQGEKGTQVQFAKCCDPMPGQPVLGYITKSPGITVHHKDCKSFAKSTRDAARIVEASWEGENMFEASLRVVIRPRPNDLADLTNALRPMNIDIFRATYGPNEEGMNCFAFCFEAASETHVKRAIRALQTVSGVTSVTRDEEAKTAAFAAAG